MLVYILHPRRYVQFVGVYTDLKAAEAEQELQDDSDPINWYDITPVALTTDKFMYSVLSAKDS